MTQAEAAARLRAAGATLVVTNLHPTVVRVYASVGASRFPIGRSRPNATESFRLRPTIIHMGRIRLVAIAQVGASTFVSDYVDVGPGDRVEWELRSVLARSRLMVRRANHRPAASTAGSRLRDDHVMVRTQCVQHDHGSPAGATTGATQ